MLSCAVQASASAASGPSGWMRAAELSGCHKRRKGKTTIRVPGMRASCEPAGDEVADAVEGAKLDPLGVDSLADAWIAQNT